jgi:outer membrane protein assembly factor BamB
VDSSGKLSSLKSYKAAGAVTATPVVYGGRVYVGCQNGSAGKFIVLDAKTMKAIYTADMKGYPQGSMLVSTGYEQTSGKIYVYSTYNAKPGGITVFEDCKGQTKVVKTELFTPDGDKQQYCISTISAGEDGTLYYKNDSGNIFALKEKNDITSLLKKIISFFKNTIAKIEALLGKK